MSMKKKLGASSATTSSIRLPRLRSIIMIATSTVMPRPSDSTTLGVGVPGRCRLATARRSRGRLERGAARASRITSAAASRKARKAALAPITNQMASGLSRALNTVSSINARVSSDRTPMSSQRALRRAPATVWRNRAAAGTSRASIRGPSEKTSVVMTPKAAASSNGPG